MNMRNTELSPYVTDAEFAYPHPYTPLEDAAFIASAERAKAIPTTLEFTPYEALTRWVRSNPGHWQARQAARYPTFHRDLDTELMPIDQRENPTNFRRGLLNIMTSERPDSRYVGAHTDFHPIGHMVRALIRLDFFLDNDGPLRDLSLDPYLLDVIRHGMATHDIAETEFSGIRLHHPRTVGDISAAVGKTAEDREIEGAIHADLLEELYGDIYDKDFIELMTIIVGHRVKAEDEELSLYHSINELAHHDNAALTGAGVGEAAPDVAPLNSVHANLMTLLAEQSEVLLTRKIDEAFEHSPKLNKHLGETVSHTMGSLAAEAACREENPGWIDWRESPPVMERFPR